MYNHWNYIFETNDLNWNSFIFYDKSVNRGADWWVRLDGHRYNNLDLYYLDINPFVTGNPEPRAFLPYSVAMILRHSGRGMYLLNKIAPISFVLIIAQDYKIVYDLLEKYRKSRESIDGNFRIHVWSDASMEMFAVFISFKYICTWFEAKLGARLGTLILPGIGTLLGSLGGGISERN